MKTEALTTTLGVEVSDIDLSEQLSTDVVAALRRLFAAHSLLLSTNRRSRPTINTAS